MFNRVELLGNLTRDPELRFTADGTPFCYLRVATDRGRGANRTTDFHFVVAWRELATNCNQYLHVGSRVFVEGRLERNAYAKEDGHTVERTRIVAARVHFVGGGVGPSQGPSAIERDGDDPTHIAETIASLPNGTERREPVEESA